METGSLPLSPERADLGEFVRDYIRSNREVSKRLKEAIYRVSKTKYSIGPYEEPKAAENGSPAVSLDETLHTMQALGVDLKIIDK